MEKLNYIVTKLTDWALEADKHTMDANEARKIVEDAWLIESRKGEASNNRGVQHGR